MPPISPTPKPPKPFGWSVEVEFSKSMIYTPGYEKNWRKTFDYKGSSEGSARTRAMSKKHARAVLKTTPYMTEADYIRAVGNYWERGY